jgi:hypothetical protein
VPLFAGTRGAALAGSGRAAGGRAGPGPSRRRAARQVTVVESHSIPGGAAHAWVQDGYHFESGPSLYSGMAGRRARRMWCRSCIPSHVCKKESVTKSQSTPPPACPSCRCAPLASRSAIAFERALSRNTAAPLLALGSCMLVLAHGALSLSSRGSVSPGGRSTCRCCPSPRACPSQRRPRRVWTGRARGRGANPIAHVLQAIDEPLDLIEYNRWNVIIPEGQFLTEARPRTRGNSRKSSARACRSSPGPELVTASCRLDQGFASA